MYAEEPIGAVPDAVDIDTFSEHREVLLAIAYRMLGSVADAQDAVQDAWLRWASADHSAVRQPRAYLIRTISRLCLDRLRSATSRREVYLGPWLPEPLATDPDVADEVAQAESVSMALLVVLETLSPLERAVFVLREAFDLPYGEIARVVDRTEANCRQLAARARRHVAERRPRFDPPAERRDELVRQFFAACEAGDVGGLERMLAEDVVFYGDGGGRGPAVREPVRGPLRVARFMLGLTRQAARFGLRLEPAEVNGSPGVRVLDPSGGVVNVLSLDVVDGRVAVLRSVVNPDKLRHLGPLSDLLPAPGGAGPG